MRLIGIHGKKRAGKDEAGKALIDDGFALRKFAGPVYDALTAIDPIVDFGTRPDDRIGDIRVSDIVNEIGWEAAKDQYPEIRRLLQRVGTEAGRDIHGKRCWTHLAMNDLAGDIVWTDVRFDEEASAIRRAGGAIIGIERADSPESEDTHSSEAGISDRLVDVWITNDGTIEALHAEVHTAARILQPLPLQSNVAPQPAAATNDEEE